MRFLPISLLPLAVVGTESETALLVPSETPRSLLELSEVPVNSFSEAPFSDFPHSDYPFSTSDCPDTNDDVLNALYDAFGEENCIHDNFNSGVECYVEVTGRSGGASYVYKILGDTSLPESLMVFDAYTGVSSFAQFIYFVEECLDTVEDQLRTIANFREERSCINEAGSFSYGIDGKKETSCDKVSELPFKKQQKKCKKCPGVCRTSEWCKCVDNPLAFPLDGSKKTLTCDKLEGMKEKKKKKKCKEKEIRGNCPSICKGFCSKPPYKASPLRV